MGFIQRFREARASRIARERSAQADANSRFLEILARINSLEGDLKNPSIEAGLRFPAVSAAVALLSNELAKLPIQVYRNKDGFNELTPEDPYQYVIGRQWTTQETAYKAEKRFWHYVFTEGIGYAVIRMVGRRLDALEVMEPDRILRIWDGREMMYQVRETGEYIERGRMIEVAWRYKKRAFAYGYPYTGRDYVSPITHGWPAIRAGLLALRYSSRHFGGGALPAAVVQTSAQNEKALKNLVKDFNAALRRMNTEQQQILPLPAAISDVKTLGINPEQSQLEAQRRMSVEECARIWGIPPAQLQELSRGTYRNTEQSARTLSQQSLSPWTEDMGGEMTLRLYGPTRRNMSVKKDLRAMLRGDFKTEADAVIKLTGGQPVFTQNDGRRRFDLPPVDGGDKLSKTPGTAEEDGEEPDDDMDPVEPDDDVMDPDDPDADPEEEGMDE